MTTTTSERMAWSPGLTQMYSSHHGMLVSLAKQRVDSVEAAEDVVNQVFLRYHERQCNPAAGKELSYLRSMVLNEGTSVVRRTIRGRELVRLSCADIARSPSGHAVESKLPTPEDEVVVAEIASKVQAAIAALPERQRQVLVLRYQMGLSESEIASKLGISRGSVKSHASRARRTLAGLLDSLEN